MIKKLRDFCICIAECGFDFTKNPYFCEKRNELQKIKEELEEMNKKQESEESEESEEPVSENCLSDEYVDSKCSFLCELQTLINKYNKEKDSNTPDFILAQYLNNCLINFNLAQQQRSDWFSS